MTTRSSTGKRSDATLELAHRRLEHLYEISKLLTRFANAGRTLEDILLVVAREIPLATTILLLQGTSGVRMMQWRAENLGAERLLAAEEHARRRYADIVRSAGAAGFDRDRAAVGVLPGVAGLSKERPAEVAPKRFVTLPLVVERSPVFGALQIESLHPLDELELSFVSAVVSQLAVALDRRALFDALQEASEARREHAERARAEAKERQVLAEVAEHRYRALVDNLDQAFVWEADAAALHVFYVSSRAEQMLGHPLARWTATPNFWLEIVHPAEREIFRLALRKAMAEGTDQRLDHRVIAADGSVRWLHTGMHIATERGAPVVQAVSVDITASKEDEARDRFLAEASRVLVAAIEYDELVAVLVRSAVPALGDVCVIDVTGETGELDPTGVVFADPGCIELAEVVRNLTPGSRGQALQARVLLSGAPVLLQDDAAVAMVGDDAHQRQVVRASGVRSILALPLLARGRALGVLTLASRSERRYSPAEIALGEEFALRAGLVLDNAWLYRDAGRRSAMNKTITDNAAACLVMVDAGDRVTFMNPAAVTMTGYSLADLEGRRLHDVLHGIEAPSGPSAEADAPPWSSPTRAREDTFVRRDGTSFPVSCNVAPLARGGAVIEFRDLTVEKQAEHFRELFVGMLGHDLRNPLGAIVLGATLVLERGGLPAEDERILHLLLASAERMNRMIEQILDFTRGRLGGGIPIVRKRIDVCDLARRIVDEGAVAHPARVFDLVMPFACAGEWDPDRLEQVVSNLVGNAITHGLPDRPIQIRVACAGEIVEFVIQNEGAPIPAELLPILFDPFRRGAALGTSKHGLGLGLYITEQIVHAHGGAIRVESTAEEGVTFTVTLPLHAPRVDLLDRG